MPDEFYCPLSFNNPIGDEGLAFCAEAKCIWYMWDGKSDRTCAINIIARELSQK